MPRRASRVKTSAPKTKHVKKSRSTKLSKPLTWRAHAGTALTQLGTHGLNVLRKKLGLNTEIKYISQQVGTFGSATVITSTLQKYVNPLIIAQGAGPTQRNGASLRITRLLTRFAIQQTAAATTSALVRIIGVRCGRMSGALPSNGQVLVTVADILSPKTTEFVSENLVEGFKIIFDQTFVVGPTGNGSATYSVPPGQADVVMVGHDYTPLTLHCEWNNADTTGVLANMTLGGVAYYAMTDALHSNGVQFACTQFASFVDN